MAIFEVKPNTVIERELDAFFVGKNFDFMEVVIPDTIDITKQDIDKIAVLINNHKLPIERVKFYIHSTTKGMYDSSRFLDFIKLNNYISSKYKTELNITESNIFLSYSWTLDEVIEANLKIDNITREVLDARIDGRPLSPLEKYLYIYDYVTSFQYKEVENWPDNSHLSRNIINVLNGDKIVCVGYSSLLKVLCDKVGIPCFTMGVEIENLENLNKVSGSHQANTVFIKDDIYNIDGVYYSDACWDSARIDDPSKRYNFFLLPIEDLKNMRTRKVTIKEHGFVDSFYNAKTPLNSIKNGMQLEKLCREYDNDFSTLVPFNNEDFNKTEALCVNLKNSISNLSRFEFEARNILNLFLNNFSEDYIISLDDKEMLEKIYRCYDSILLKKVHSSDFQNHIDDLKNTLNKSNSLNNAENFDHCISLQSVLLQYYNRYFSTIQNRYNNNITRSNSIENEAKYLIASSLAQKSIKN